jgi:uncharacterized repeat protein (TIGR02543 family)
MLAKYKIGLISSFTVTAILFYGCFSHIPTVLPKPPTPTASLSIGVYNTDLTLELLCDNVDASIFYSINGTDPDMSSHLYNDSINLNQIQEGAQQFIVKAIAIVNGNYSNRSGIAEFIYIIDSDAPVITIVSPEPDTVINDATPVLEYTIIESEMSLSARAVRTVDILVDGTATNKTNEDELDELTNGNHTISITVIDEAGNSTTAVCSFTVDTFPAADVSDFSASLAEGMPTFSWIEPDDSDFDYCEFTYEPGGSTPIVVNKGTNSYILTGIASNTDYIFTLKTIDAAGNVSSGRELSAIIGPYFSTTLSEGGVYIDANEYYVSQNQEWSIGTLDGDIFGTEYAFNMMVASTGEADFAYTLVLVQGSQETELASTTIAIVDEPSYSIHTATVTGIDPDGQSGAVLKLRMDVSIEGSEVAGMVFPLSSVVLPGMIQDIKSPHDDTTIPPGSTVVTYEGNGNTWGIVPVDSNYYSEGNTVSVLGNSGGLERSGYIFDGWNTASDGYGTTYVQDETFTIGTEDVTFYAHWIPWPGEMQWSYNMGYSVTSGPAIGSDGTIYVGNSTGRRLYAINPDGTLLWSYLTGGNVSSSPVIGLDGTIYVGNGTGNEFFAINPDGTRKWSFEADHWVDSSPAIGPDGTVCFESNGMLYAINPDGTLQMTINDDFWVFSSPAIGLDGTIFAGTTNTDTFDDQFSAINSEGTLLWSYTIDDIVLSSPAISSDGTIYFGCADGNLFAINSDGTLRWSYATGDKIYSSPAISVDGTIYVGSGDGNLYAINSDGTLKWSFAAGDKVNSSPAIGSDGTIYVGSWDDNLYAINPDGTLKWSYTTGGYVSSSPAIGDDGTIYVGSNDYKLYAISSSSEGLSDSAWPMFHQNNQHTGRQPLP